MSRLLSDILGAPEPTFTHEIDRLERMAGHPKVDVRLISDVIVDTKELLKTLELDPDDSTIIEMYYGLQKMVLANNHRLAEKLNVSDNDSSEQMIEKCIKHVQGLSKGREIWSLKNVTSKRELNNHPPKKLLKALGLRSLDSALKRESIGELTFLGLLLESNAWRDTYYANAQKLNSSDFTKKAVTISVIDYKRQERLRNANHALRYFVYKHEESASLMVVVPKHRFRGDVLFFVDSLLRETNSLIRWGAFAKLLSMRPDFSKWLVSLRRNGLDATSSLYFNFSWGPMHLLLEKKASQSKPPLFEPHVYDEDVLSVADEYLAGHAPYIVRAENGIKVSAHPSDVILNVINNAEADKSAAIYGQRALYDELFSRYLAQEVILSDVLRTRGS